MTVSINPRRRDRSRAKAPAACYNPQMADQPVIQIDDDWKKAAQEEKRRLAEQAGTPRPAESPATNSPASTERTRDPAARREAPPASFASIVQSMMTQALLYLGELAVRGGEPMLDLDMAKRHIDMLGVLEEKTRGNLSREEQKLLDGVLYDLRNRFVSTASQFIM
jgi:hypothetical protein